MTSLERVQFLLRLALQEYGRTELCVNHRQAVILDKVQTDMHRAFVTLSQVIDKETKDVATTD